MSKPENIFVASFNSSSYEWWGRNTLLAKGQEDAKATREHLIEIHPGIFKNLVILSSNLPPAQELAETVAAGTDTMIIPSKRIAAIGDRPDIVESLDATVETVYQEETGQELGDQQLLIVTASGLAAAIYGYDSSYAPTNRATVYERGSWDNSNYDPAFETLMAREFGFTPATVQV